MKQYKICTVFTASTSHCQHPHEMKFSVHIIFVPQTQNVCLFSLTPTDKMIISLLRINGTFEKAVGLLNCCTVKSFENCLE